MLADEAAAERTAAVGAAQPTSGVLAPLRVPSFRAFVVIQSVRQLCMWQQLTAVTILLLRLSDNAVIVTASTVTQFAPIILIAGWIGVQSDRMNRARLLLKLSIASSTVTCVLLALVAAGRATPANLLLLSLAAGLLQMSEHPVRRTLVSDLLPRELLVAGVGVNAAVITGARTIGPAIAGVIIAAFGATVCVAVAAIGLVTQTALLARLRTSPQASAEGSRRGLFRAGLRHIRESRKVARPMILVAAAATIILNLSSLLAVFVTRDLHAADTTYTLLWAAQGLGSVLGVALIANASGSIRRLTTCAVLLGIAVASLAAAPNVPVACGILILSGVLSVVVMVGSEARIQLACDPKMLGRVIAVVSVVTFAFAPVTAPALGFIAERVGARWSLVALGGVATVAGVVVRLLSESPRDATPADAVLPQPTY